MQGFGAHGGFPKGFAAMRIQQAIAAKYKSPACEDFRDFSGWIFGSIRPAKKNKAAGGV
jgi:hypothetical protein